MAVKHLKFPEQSTMNCLAGASCLVFITTATGICRTLHCSCAAVPSADDQKELRHATFTTDVSESCTARESSVCNKTWDRGKHETQS